MSFLKRRHAYKDAAQEIAEGINTFETVYEKVKDFFDEPIEHLFMLIFDADDNCVDIRDIANGAGTTSSVAIDMPLCESIWASIDGTGLKWGLSHNHPHMVDASGKWQQTLVSEGDIVVTECAKTAQFNLYPDLEYVGHFVVNKEGNTGEEINKIIFIEGNFKYSTKVLEAVKEGEL